ncbi:divergent polysaccharide deacetylase family protein [Hongsoonwoonella zoysiae]|uniref:divergent polysaccharide deacetylase family protein n=1 Tax=Hongsoonwoonella zoysiae TaxID=2821844 RepID=UPI001AEF1351|nr:divergent polysaccharide deacetylase family protein [Hongsoonwoonella zoysiae]
MSSNDLSAPLGLGKRKIMRLPFGLVGAGLLVILITTALVWIGVVDDPLGGEPTAVVRLERSLEGLSARDIGVVGIDPVLNDESSSQTANGKREAQKPLGPRFEPNPDLSQTVAAGVTPPIPSSLSIRADSRVMEPGPYGPLPAVSADGLRPLDLYARPADNSFPNVPKIAIVVGGLGLSQTTTQMAIEKLPPETTFAFAPYGSSLDRWMQRARQQGHEMLLQLPLEPFDYPDNDPGPHTLLVNLKSDQIHDRLAWLLSRLTNYVGVTNYTGARFTSDEAALQGLFSQVTDRGLMYLDDGSSSRSVAATVASGEHTPFSKVDIVLDEVPKPDEITSRLLQLEGVARAQGMAVGGASALPVTIEQLAEWSRTLEERGLQLIPVSASIDRSVGN